MATEGFFTNGPPQAAAFQYQMTFNTAGSNPYYCVVHVQNSGMTGFVEVSAPPPGVPNGTNGTAMTVAKFPLVPDGGRLNVSWDLGSCAPVADHAILYGFGSGLPSTLGGSYTLEGSRCNIGSSPAQPFTWTGVPDPAIEDPSSRLMWFIVVTNDDGVNEGSWSSDSDGVERNGASASSECGTTTKSLANLCGQ